MATAEAPAVYLHCDVDKMYFSVEAIEQPALAAETRAVIISVDPREYARAVVTTANGVARTIGINSGMSTAMATRLAREAGIDVVYVPPRHEVYGRYSRRLMDVLREATPLLEQRSIDAQFSSTRGFEVTSPGRRNPLPRWLTMMYDR